MRVGILGGTFDPVHLGHLLIADEARVSLDLEEVLFIPVGNPWMKADMVLSPPHHRLNMVRLAIASNPFFRTSSMEIDRAGPTYTVDTLEELRHETGGEADLFFILGIDSLRELHSWKEPARVLELCTLVAASRPGREELDLEFLDEIAPGASGNVNVLKGPKVEISGTEIRRRARMGLSVRYQVPEDVERYIRRYGLYREAEVEQ